jgi:hypothetical protein
MAADAKSKALWAQRDTVNLFRHLNGMWFKVILETLEDLLDQGMSCNPNSFQNELRAAGIDVNRLEVAMAAVLHKNARNITWDKFWEVYEPKISRIPMGQRQELRAYWIAGPRPGLMGQHTPAGVVLGGGDWFVTGMGGSSQSLVIGVGFSSFTGTIDFQRADGTKVSRSIGIVGPSAGVSVLPGVSKLANRYPALVRFFAPESFRNADRLKWLQSFKSPLAQVLFKHPSVHTALKVLTEITKNTSIGPESLPSAAIGMVVPNAPHVTDLDTKDLSGSCVAFATAGTAAIGQFGVTFLAFGGGDWKPWTDPQLKEARGIALISTASISVQIPSLAASQTLYFGEIV